MHNTQFFSKNSVLQKILILTQNYQYTLNMRASEGHSVHSEIVEGLVLSKDIIVHLFFIVMKITISWILPFMTSLGHSQYVQTRETG